jgi:hypothetical protein
MHQTRAQSKKHTSRFMTCALGCLAVVLGMMLSPSPAPAGAAQPTSGPSSSKAAPSQPGRLEPAIANRAGAGQADRTGARGQDGSGPTGGPLDPARPHFVASVPHLPRGAVRLGPMAASAPISLDISLIPAHHQELANFLQQLYTQGSPLYHHYLAPGQFATLYGAPSSVVAQVRSVLASYGMSVGPVSANGLLLPVQTTIGTAESVFGVSIAQVRLADGRLAFVNTTTPSVPSSIEPYVQGVVGLDTAAVPQPRATTCISKCPAQEPAPNQNPPCNLAPTVAISNQAYLTGDSPTNAPDYPTDQLFIHYGFSSLVYPNGTLAAEEGLGQTVALFELSTFSQTDVSQYAACFGVPQLLPNSTPELTTIPVDGGTNAFSVEADLDVELLMSLVPYAAIDVYEAPQTPVAVIDEYNQIVQDDTASVISTSYGLCESDLDQATIAAENLAFEQAAAQGQTVLAASGDSGSEDCATSGLNNTQLAVDDPSSQPFVTGVGGTSYNDYSLPATEVVWNDKYGAGGGGISSIWQMPAWQQGFGVINSYSTGATCGASPGNDCREVPDVSANADPAHGYVIYSQGQWTVIGGTSAAAPLWAALIAYQNQACAGNNDPPTGFANPRLYALAEQPAADPLIPITTGNNDLTGSNQGAYPALAVPVLDNYSMASGLGVPTGNLFTDLGTGGYSNGLLCDGSPIPPIVTSVSPESGSPAGGAPMVTITGNNFTGVTEVDFGSTPAVTYRVISNTEIEAIPPAQSLPPGETSLQVDVKVTEGTLSSSANPPYDTYTYTSGPTVVAVTAGNGSGSPGNLSCSQLLLDTGTAAPFGPSSGGQQVTICGTNLSGTSKVQFFTPNICVPISSGSGAPPLSTPGCGSSRAACGAFTPIGNAPAACFLTTTQIGSVSNLTVNGQQLQQVTATTVPDPNVTAQRSCDLTDVIVTSSSGTSYQNPGLLLSYQTCPPESEQPTGLSNTGDTYGFTDLPVVTAISSSTGTLQGRSPVMVFGYNFEVNTGYSGFTQCSGNPSIIGVTFGNPQLFGTNCRVVSDGEITVDVPVAVLPGLVDVQVEAASAPSGTSGQPFSSELSPPVVADRFNYVGCSTSYQTSNIFAIVPSTNSSGYLLADGNGTVATCGSAAYQGSAADPYAYNVSLQAPALPPSFTGCPYAPPSIVPKSRYWIVGMASTPNGPGYWQVDQTGTVYNFGTAGFYGDIRQLNPSLPPGGSNASSLRCPIVSMASTSDGGGYWLVASDGGVFSFGDAVYYGSTGGLRLSAPIVGITASPDGEGYWLVASDGGVFSFGDSALYFGSMGGVPLNEPVVAMASTPSGAGYWLVGADGGVFAFGDASYYGAAFCYQSFQIAAGGYPGNWIVGIASTPDGGGYWLVSQNGTVLPFGDAPFEGMVAPGGALPPVMPGGDAACP